VAKYLKRCGTLAAAVWASMKELRGSYALAVLSRDEPGTLVAVRNGCPLVIGRTPTSGLVASDVTAMLAYTRDVTYLEDGDIAVLTAASGSLLHVNGTTVHRPITRVAWDAEAAEKSGYPHFMLKEIHEQPQAITDTLRGHYNLEDGEVMLPELGLSREQLISIKDIWLIACGTSWHAGMVGRYLIETLARTPTHGDIGSEFRYRDPLIGKDDLVIAISQSGETADTLAAVREARRKGAQVISIVNVVGSTLARESDGVLYTRCGPEIGVASTKAFTGQLTALYLLALHLARSRGVITADESRTWFQRFMMLPGWVEQILKKEAEVEAIAERYALKRNFLYLGRGINYPIALEGALKLKEISYIHAEGYAAGEMKHGPIALIDEDTPVVVLAPHDALYEKTVNNLMEVKARSAPVIAFTNEEDRDLALIADAVFTIPDAPPLMSPVLFAIPLQLLAYHIAVLRGADVDQPRNLAKSVTVE
jgi:glucosamine--fructose-6-phosphate aminotransferase (isomerizing)